jgi:catechol 2,3-dioxygenase-like lactoylglutathione lyase family enzyme
MFTHGLIEVILYAQDMAAQVAFYRDQLGLTVLYPSEVSNFANEYWVVLDTGACKLILHGGGDRRLGADTPKLVFGVDDIQAARTTLLQRDVAIGDVRSPAPGVLVCDGVDPEGNPFSIEAHS